VALRFAPTSPVALAQATYGSVSHDVVADLHMQFHVVDHPLV
jgi:hypothetical protein